MRTILAPVNFSASSNHAARYAADMAMAIQADLQLIHVLQLPISTDMPMTDYVFDQLESSALEGLRELSRALHGVTGGKLKIATHLEVGIVDPVLEAYCKEIQPFAVVMGVSGGSLEKLLAGNNTARAIHHIPYPLIVVPANAGFHGIKKIVLACDLNDIAGGIPVSLNFLKDLKELFHASFEVININTGKQLGEEQTIFAFGSWKDRFKELFPDIRFIDMDSVGEGIRTYLEDHDAGLVMVFPKQHGFFEFHKSQAKKIALNSPVPVMSIHA